MKAECRSQRRDQTHCTVFFGVAHNTNVRIRLVFTWRRIEIAFHPKLTELSTISEVGYSKCFDGLIQSTAKRVRLLRVLAYLAKVYQRFGFQVKFTLSQVWWKTRLIYSRDIYVCFCTPNKDKGSLSPTNRMHLVTLSISKPRHIVCI